MRMYLLPLLAGVLQCNSATAMMASPVEDPTIWGLSVERKPAGLEVAFYYADSPISEIRQEASLKVGESFHFLELQEINVKCRIYQDGEGKTRRVPVTSIIFLNKVTGRKIVYEDAGRFQAWKPVPTH